MLNLLALGLGPQELWIVLAVVLVLFGGRKIPELMRGVGRGVGELQKGVEEGKKSMAASMAEARKDDAETEEPAVK